MSRIATIALLLLFLNASAQHQERTVLVYNVAFGGFSAGIGSLINKPKEVNWKKAFVRGFWQGSIGGLINYSGKKVVYLVNKNQQDVYAWPAKLLHAAGYSIIENAAAYAPFLQNWTIDAGLLRFDFSSATKKIKARLLPEALVATIIAANYGKFDAGTSLRTGEIIFKNNNLLNLPTLSEGTSGVTFGRAIVYAYGPQSGYTKDRILSHELVHRFQYNEYQVFNTWLQPFYKKTNSTTLKKIFSRYVYADIPFLFLPYYTLYRVRLGQHYYRNFYEFEAERFSTNSYVPR
ncbi:hypothetical protein QWZ08_21100 [Ferruginibacter paludis]|uniref:hypothetical protein n=1 Tax=Ferruginibacter paludis TaxID=1310417 RepID=UPI0025B31F78|nr:hypothetical protein [Ferruginibacter paludis]MDN3658163.1 hypothetical protein [Ferruginibacter paludis]